MLDTLDFVYQEFKDLVKEIKDEKHLDEIRVKFLGKNGLMTNEAKKIATILPEYKTVLEYIIITHIGISINLYH